jgi:cytochrome c oxidase assembly protein subunit 15
MADNSRASRPAAYDPALAVFAGLACAWVFLLVTLGAFTTSIGAGMAFPDWPLSNGSLNPKGWLTTLNMFAEHSHRLSAGIETILSLGLAIWTSRVSGTPRWRRKLAWWAFGICVIQAVVGGLRVLLNHIQLDSLETSVGELFAMLHACLAQALACCLLAVAAASARRWIERPVPVRRRLQQMGIVCCILVFVQLAIAAVMRHSFSGLSIPFFPFSTADHHLLPPVWGFRVAIQFAHRVMAAILSVASIWYAVLIWRDPGATPGMKTGASLLVSLLALQVMLGGTIIWTFRDPAITTAHVLVGALTLTTIFWLTWIAHRDRIET